MRTKQNTLSVSLVKRVSRFQQEDQQENGLARVLVLYIRLVDGKERFSRCGNGRDIFHLRSCWRPCKISGSAEGEARARERMRKTQPEIDSAELHIVNYALHRLDFQILNYTFKLSLTR